MLQNKYHTNEIITKFFKGLNHLANEKVWPLYRGINNLRCLKYSHLYSFLHFSKCFKHRLAVDSLCFLHQWLVHSIDLVCDRTRFVVTDVSWWKINGIDRWMDGWKMIERRVQVILKQIHKLFNHNNRHFLKICNTKKSNKGKIGGLKPQ